MAEAKSKFDYINEAQVTIGEVHANIHRGLFYSAGHAAEGVADDGTVELLIQVGSTRACHARFRGAAGGDHKVELFEAPTFSAAGTAVTPRNRNRFTGDSAVTTITHTPTTSVDGTLLIDGIQPGGAGGGPHTPGAATSGFEEWVLKTSTVYLARIQNLAGTAQPLSIGIDFYEPDLES